MKMLITGHRGLLGSACVRQFAGKYAIITSHVDLRDQEEVHDLFRIYKPDVVIHCAAKVGGVKANRDKPVEFLTDNLRIQTNVISEAGNSNVKKLVFIGTSCMFPRDAVLPVVEESLLTGRLEDSVEAYAIAKIAGWRLCKAWFEQHGRKFITVNPSNIYGPNDNYGESAHVIPALINRIHAAQQSHAPLTVWGDGSAVREFIYSADVASAIEVALEKWDSPEVLSIGTGISTTIRELVDVLVRYFRPDIEVKWDTTQPAGIPRKTFDVSKLMRLGWEPKFTLTEGLEKTLNDYQRGGFRK